MEAKDFHRLLADEVATYKKFMETDQQQLIVKGFIDVDRNVYPIVNDARVIFKIVEMLLIPKLNEFALSHGMKLLLPRESRYPNLAFRDSGGQLHAVEFESALYDGVNAEGFTICSYWDYFRDRDSVRGMEHPYNAYASHLVFGVLYKQCSSGEDGEVYPLSELSTIHSVIESLVFFVQPKWRVADDRPGVGTRNIGSITDVEKLKSGKGPFSDYGVEVFDDYWQNYFNVVDARNLGLGAPRYLSIEDYLQHLKGEAAKLKAMETAQRVVESVG